MQRLTPNLENWLKQFAEAVRNRDFVAGRKLFDSNVTAFGTVCFRADGIEALVANQWKVAWPITKDFDFDYAAARVLLEGEQAVVIATWGASGTKRDGASVKCGGRATIVLRNDAGGWKAVHSHYSRLPEKKG